MILAAALKTVELLEEVELKRVNAASALQAATIREARTYCLLLLWEHRRFKPGRTIYQTTLCWREKRNARSEASHQDKRAEPPGNREKTLHQVQALTCTLCAIM